MIQPPSFIVASQCSSLASGVSVFQLFLILLAEMRFFSGLSRFSLPSKRQIIVGVYVTTVFYLTISRRRRRDYSPILTSPEATN